MSLIPYWIRVVISWLLPWMRWQPERRPRCVIFYFVAQTPNTISFKFADDETGAPPGSLDSKLKQVLAVIDSLPRTTIGGKGDVRFFDRAIWNEPHPPAIAKVVDWRVGAP